MNAIKSSARTMLACLIVSLGLTVHAHSSLYSMQEMAEKVPDAELRAQSSEIEGIFDTLAQRSGVDAELIYSTSPDINAFACNVGDKKIVVMQQGLVDLVKDDRDAMAAVLGHELAHHKANHIEAGRRKQENVRLFGAILGAVVGAKVGAHSGAAAGALAGTAVGVGGNLVALKFNRDQEMEADRMGLQWITEAGFNPDGMLRLQKQLAALASQKGNKSSILSTHPTSEKRYAVAAKIIVSHPPAQDILDRPMAPLVSAEALAAANRSITYGDDKRIAALLEPMQAPAAALVAPLQKSIAFERYASLSNQMSFAGANGETALLAKNKISRAQWTKAEAEFQERAGEDHNVMGTYTVAYYRATQGRMADYGKDLADSYEHGQTLKLDPPYPLETAIAAKAAVAPYQGQTVDVALRKKLDTQVLASFHLSYYDYLIGHAWWMRKAQLAALGGNSKLLSQLIRPAADADADEEDASEKTAAKR